MTINPTFKAPASLYSTRDGGRTWKRQPLPPSLGNNHTTALSPVAGDATAGFSVRTSRHGPLSLSILPPPHRGGVFNVGQTRTAHTLGFTVYFTTATRGFATDGRTMLVTQDGGATWKSFSPNRSLDAVTQLDFISQSVGFAILPRSNTGDLLLTTTDGGHTWTTVPRRGGKRVGPPSERGTASVRGS